MPKRSDMALYHFTLLWKLRTLVRHPIRTTRVFVDKESPLVAKLLPAAALIYAALPLDFLPDIFPIIGWFDDASVFILLVSYALSRIPDSVFLRHGLDPKRTRIDFTRELP